MSLTFYHGISRDFLRLAANEKTDLSIIVLL